MSRATSLQCTARLAPIQPAVRPSSGAAAGWLSGGLAAGKVVGASSAYILAGLPYGTYTFVIPGYVFISGYRLPPLVAASHRVTAP
jgi:hypothetical protein